MNKTLLLVILTYKFLTKNIEKPGHAGPQPVRAKISTIVARIEAGLYKSCCSFLTSENSDMMIYGDFYGN